MKAKLVGHVLQSDICRLPFAVNVTSHVYGQTSSSTSTSTLFIKNSITVDWLAK